MIEAESSYINQSLSSLREFVFVSQKSMQVEVYRRKDGAKWEYERLTEPSDMLVLETIDYTLTLDALHRSIPLKRSKGMHV